MTRWPLLSIALILIVIWQDAEACIRSHQLSCDCEAMQTKMHDLRERQIKDMQERQRLINKLDQSNSRLAQKENDIKIKAREHKTTIDKKDAEINEHKTTIDKKDAEINEHKTTIDKKDAEINEHKTTIDKKDAEINEHKTTIDKKDAKINEHKTTIDKKDAEINEHKTTIDKKDAKINEHKTTIDKKDAEINEHKTTIDKKDAKIGECNSTIGRMNVQISDLMQILREKNISVIHLKQDLWELTTEHEDSVVYFRRELADKMMKRAQAEQHLIWSWCGMIFLSFVVSVVSILGYKYRKDIREEAGRAGICFRDSLCHHRKKPKDISNSKDYSNVHPTKLPQKEEKTRTMEVTI